jgi:hypothetical protein
MFIWWSIHVIKKNLKTRETAWLLIGDVESVRTRLAEGMENTNYLYWTGDQVVTVEWKEESFYIHSSRIPTGRPVVGKKTKGPLVPYEGWAVLTITPKDDNSCWVLLTGTYTFDLPQLIDNLEFYAPTEDETNIIQEPETLLSDTNDSSELDRNPADTDDDEQK